MQFLLGYLSLKLEASFEEMKGKGHLSARNMAVIHMTDEAILYDSVTLCGVECQQNIIGCNL